MSNKAAATVNRAQAEVHELWLESAQRQVIEDEGATVVFTEAPGGRGTEIHVELPGDAPTGKVGELAEKLLGSEPLAKVKDELRHFKQLAETGEIPRSDATPEGERVERKLKQRSAQPLDDSELEKAGV